MSAEHSITKQLQGLRDGDPEAVQAIWERYLSKLIRLARIRLKGSSNRVADEEDVVQVAFENFFRQVKEDRFSKLRDRDDLWQILAMLVDRRSSDQIRKLAALKAGTWRVRGDSINENLTGTSVLESIEGFEPSPSSAADLADAFRARLDELPDDEYRTIALRKLEGLKNQEIAARLEMLPRTLERRLAKIREIWSKGLSE